MKKTENKDKQELKKMWKMYLYGVCGTLIVMHFIELYKNRNNIYHNNKLKISYEESKELSDELSEKVGKSINRDDNALVLSATFDNDNLTEDEKEYIYDLVDLLNDNPYLMKSYAYENLRELDIKYGKEPGKEYSKNVIGTYDDNNNSIEIYNKRYQNDTLYHELIHCVYADDYIVKLPIFFDEGMTELLSNEYFGKNPFLEEKSYPYEVTMVKILCELVGSDKVLEAYSKESIEIVEEALKEKIGLSDPEELIYSMERISKCLHKEQEVKESDLNNVLFTLTNYYENNVDIDSDEYKIYMYNTSLLKTLKGSHPYTSYRFFISSSGYYVKVYFSEKLKEEYPEPFRVTYQEDITESSNKVYEKTYNIMGNEQC